MLQVRFDAPNCQHDDQHTCVQHAEGQLDLETDPVMVVCRREGVCGCGYISRETPLVMHTRHGCADIIDLGREEVQTSHQACKRLRICSVRVALRTMLRPQVCPFCWSSGGSANHKKSVK